MHYNYKVTNLYWLLAQAIPEQHPDQLVTGVVSLRNSAYFHVFDCQTHVMEHQSIL